MESPDAAGNCARAQQFERFVVPELAVLLHVARTMTAQEHDAEDLVQDTLLRAYRAIDRFDGAHPRAWLFTIMRNANANRHRRRRPALLEDPAATEDIACTPSDEVDLDPGGPGLGPAQPAPHRGERAVNLVSHLGISETLGRRNQCGADHRRGVHSASEGHVREQYLGLFAST
ncbi:MAG: RNA polymerase sigma factor, partial [Acidimicrobiales bacterium]